jgi:hypothetical protein
MRRFWIALTIVTACVLLAWFPLWTFYKDLRYEMSFRYGERWKPRLDALPLTLVHPDPPTRLCFVTLDDRSAEYIDLHHRMFERYVREHNKRGHARRYSYRADTACRVTKYAHTHNPYWCKFFWLRELLESDAYDYVVWVDSDVGIANFDLDFAKVLLAYESHCFAGLDNVGQYDILNAGILGIRNSTMGRDIIRAITEAYNQEGFQNRCLTSSQSLRGWFGSSCYEQGIMNDLLFQRFLEATTVLGPEYIHNGKTCEGGFLVHVYGSSEQTRANCFRQFMQD